MAGDKNKLTEKQRQILCQFKTGNFAERIPAVCA